MPPHNQNVVTIRPRSLANVLADLKEARADYEVAIADLGASDGGTVEEADADDRASAADTRVEDLRTEFDERLVEAAGLTVEDLRRAYAEALI